MLAQVMNFFGVKLETQEGILIIGPDIATVGLAEPFKVFCRWDFALMIHGSAGYSKPGRMVASSKSIRQKRPSD